MKAYDFSKNGVSIQLPDLIALQRFVNPKSYKVQGVSALTGGHRSKWRGRGMDFSETRNYQAGDEIRHMEWKTTARTGRPHIKIYEEEKEKPVFMVVDFNPSMYFGTRVAFKSVIAAQIAAIIAWTVIRQGDKLGALLYGAESYQAFMPKSRNPGILPVLEAISEYSGQYNQPSNGKPRPVSDVLSRLKRVNRPGSLVVLVSDFYEIDKESDSHFCHLREHSDILAYHVCDPLELTSPKPGLYPVANGKNGFYLDTKKTKVRDQYQQFWDKRYALLQDRFKKLKIPYQQVTGLEDIPLIIHKTFPRKRHG